MNTDVMKESSSSGEQSRTEMMWFLTQCVVRTLHRGVLDLKRNEYGNLTYTLTSSLLDTMS